MEQSCLIPFHSRCVLSGDDVDGVADVEVLESEEEFHGPHPESVPFHSFPPLPNMGPSFLKS